MKDLPRHHFTPTEKSEDTLSFEACGILLSVQLSLMLFNMSCKELSLMGKGWIRSNFVIE